MSIQKIVLKQFHEKYPHAKLREISDHTGIQITRVFRILNGAEMKVSELESFQNLTTNNQQHSLLDLARNCALNLSANKNKFIQGVMEQSLKIHFLSKPLQGMESELQYEL